jgi:hypothetical protein
VCKLISPSLMFAFECCAPLNRASQGQPERRELLGSSGTSPEKVRQIKVADLSLRCVRIDWVCLVSGDRLR